MGKWLLCHNTGIIDQKLCRKVIGTVNNEIIVLNEIHNIAGIYESAVCLYGYIRVDRFHSLRCGFYFCFTHIISRMNDLSLQVGKIYLIRIHNTDSSYSCCCQIKCCRGTKSTGTDDQNAGIQQLFLSLHSHFLENDMTGISLKLFVCKSHYLAPPPMK